MNAMVILPTPRNLFRWIEVYFQRRLFSVAFIACCFTLGIVSADSFADDSLIKSLQVKEEETQLAQRFTVRESVESPFEYALSAGYRRDNLSWSIADSGINVASEVSWKKTVIAQLRAAAKLNFWGDWQLRGIYTTGAVKSGRNQDSDYAGNNRTQEFSRSDNKTGGAVRDLSLGLGRKFRLFDLASGVALHVVPLAGLSIHQQNLTMYDGQQTIPTNGGAISGLHNSYDTQWKGGVARHGCLARAGQEFLSELHSGISPGRLFGRGQLEFA